MKNFSTHLAESMILLNSLTLDQVTAIFYSAQLQFNRERNAVSVVNDAIRKGQLKALREEPRKWNADRYTAAAERFDAMHDIKPTKRYPKAR